MVLREVIGIEASAIIGFDNLQAILVEVSERNALPVEVIENAEIHRSSAIDVALT